MKNMEDSLTRLRFIQWYSLSRALELTDKLWYNIGHEFKRSMGGFHDCH